MKFIFICLIAICYDASAIQNGSYDREGIYKNVVKLNVQYGNNEWSHCTATVISDYTILTAGHCISYYLTEIKKHKVRINNKSYDVEKVIVPDDFHKHYRRSQDIMAEIQNLTLREAEPTYISEAWNSFNLSVYDIANLDVSLIHTKRKINSKIPRTILSFSESQLHEKVTVVGFGYTAYVPNQKKYIYEHQEGRHYGHTQLSFENDLLAIYDLNNSPITAPGDSGGPLLDGNGHQIGITSHGSQTKRGTIFNPIRNWHTFIQLNTKR